MIQSAQDSTVTAKIYDVTGKQIRMIQLGHIPAGNYVESNRAIYWDGRTEDECQYCEKLPVLGEFTER